MSHLFCQKISKMSISKLEKQSEIIVKTSLGESFILEYITCREVSVYKLGLSKCLFLKMDGKNNKNGLTEQIQIYLDKSDAEELCQGINECIKQGLFKEPDKIG